MTLVLMQWSAVVQLASVMMVAAFFAVLARSSRRAEVQWWGLAWFANLGALLVTAYFWIAQPTHLSVWQGFYLGLKLAFVLWLLQGTWAVGRPGTELLSQRTIITAALAYGFIGGLFIPSVQVLGLVQHLSMGLLLLGGTLTLGRVWRQRGLVVHRPVSAWLAGVSRGRRLLDQHQRG